VTHLGFVPEGSKALAAEPEEEEAAAAA